MRSRTWAWGRQRTNNRSPRPLQRPPLDPQHSKSSVRSSQSQWSRLRRSGHRHLRPLSHHHRARLRPKPQHLPSYIHLPPSIIELQRRLSRSREHPSHPFSTPLVPLPHPLLRLYRRPLGPAAKRNQRRHRWHRRDRREAKRNLHPCPLLCESRRRSEERA